MFWIAKNSGGIPAQPPESGSGAAPRQSPPLPPIRITNPFSSQMWSSSREKSWSSSHTGGLGLSGTFGKPQPPMVVASALRPHGSTRKAPAKETSDSPAR